MTIGGIGENANTSSKIVSAPVGSPDMDAYSKNLKRQISDAQKQMQELAQNDELDPEIKMKKRQELQKQISDLNMQLRQHQMEERKKAQQEKQQKHQPKKVKEDTTGMSKSSMEALVSADNVLKQAKIQGDTANRLKSGAEIKRAEIKRDGGGLKRTSGDSAAISSKWDEVERMEQHAKAAAGSQLSSLTEAREKLEEVDAANGTKTKETRETETAKNAEKTKTADIGSNIDVKV